MKETGYIFNKISIVSFRLYGNAVSGKSATAFGEALKVNNALVELE